MRLRGFNNILVFVILIFFIAFSQTFVEQHGQLSVDGTKIVDKNKNSIILRGMSLYCWSNAGTQFYNANAINWLVKDWKCTVIRIPILPSSYRSNPSSEINKVKTVMDACIANGIYAVVDWHSMDGAQNDLQSAKNFFSEIARLYGNTPNLIYETWNEPVNENWSSQIKPYHEAVISAIRAIDLDNIIVCGTPHWSQDVDVASQNPIKGSINIAYTLHFYAATHKQSLRDKAATAIRNGIALFVTEWGTSEASGDGYFDTTETRRWWSFLEQNQISQANWSVAALGETSAALYPGANPNGNWTEANLKPSGKFVRQYLILMNSTTKTIFIKNIKEDFVPLNHNILGCFDLLGRKTNLVFQSFDYKTSLSSKTYIIKFQNNNAISYVNAK
jgi:endoglucanase